jgi:hypothetical protein
MSVQTCSTALPLQVKEELLALWGGKLKLGIRLDGRPLQEHCNTLACNMDYNTCIADITPVGITDTFSKVQEANDWLNGKLLHPATPLNSMNGAYLPQDIQDAKFSFRRLLLQETSAANGLDSRLATIELEARYQSIR